MALRLHFEFGIYHFCVVPKALGGFENHDGLASEGVEYLVKVMYENHIRFNI